MNELKHTPVLLLETLELLSVKPGHWYVDATFGLGGHSREILKRGGKVLGIDHDDQVIEEGMKIFSSEIKDGSLILTRRNFNELGEIEELWNKKVLGILFDFGVNSWQLEQEKRGFSFQKQAPLDMRMDTRLAVTAKDLVNGLGRKELIHLLSEIAQEKNARVITEAILEQRKKKLIETTTELSTLIEKAVGGRKQGKAGRLNPATKTFMALRIAVNSELQNIEQALPISLDVLQPGGRMLTISFHEGEDRIAKQFMAESEAKGLGKRITNKPITASDTEQQQNPRSRSAKLRAFEKGTV